MRWFVVCALALAACNGEPREQADYSATGTPAPGDMVIEASLAQASSLVTWLAGENAASQLSQFLYRSVLTYDANLNLIGDLATDWDISADNLTLTFALDPSATWHDGTPVTSADVIATFNAITAPETRTPYASDYRTIKSITALGTHQFQVVYDQPFAPALHSWASFTVLPAHILKLDDDFNQTRLKHTPLGNYLFKIKQRVPGQFTTFTAARSASSSAPYLAGFQVKVIPDQDTQFLELKAGNLDLMGLKPVQAARLTDGDRFSSTYAKHSYLANGYTFVGFNLNHPLLQNKLVRQALSYATPREQIIKAVLFGQGQPAQGPFKPGTTMFADDIQPYPFDMTKAAALLDEAGMLDTNGDGKREFNGAPIKLRLVTNQGNDQRLKTAEILQYYWRKLGIELEIQVQEWATFLEHTLYPRDYDLFILGWGLSPNPDQYLIWHSSQTGPRQFNTIDFKNAEVDTLLETARTTFDISEQQRLYTRFQEILHEEQPYLFLYVPEVTVALHRRIKAVKPAPAGLKHNLEEWYVPTGQQLRMVP